MAEKELKDLLMEQFNKEYPESPLEVMGDSEYAEIPGWITTGNYALNWIISKDMFKGLPMGRVIIFSGDPASGKSMAAISMMREPSIDTVIYFDTEGGGVTKDFATFLGIDPHKVLYNSMDTVEEMIDKMRKTIDIIEKNKVKKSILLVVDSISMLSTSREMDKEGGQDMGNKAKQTRTFFRTYLRKMQKLNICAVFTAHLTQNIGGYGPDKVVSGGTILGYAPTMEVRFSQVNAESEIEKSARGASMQKIRAEIIKSRMGTKGKRVKFDLDMQTGLDPYAGIFDILSDYQFIITAASDLDEQTKKQTLLKKGSGFYCFKSWVGTGKGDDEATGQITVDLHQRLISEKLTSNGKFREAQVGKWAKEVPWFLPEVQKLLDSFDKSLEAQNAQTVEEMLAKELGTDEEKPAKKDKKKATVEITEVSA